MALEAECYGENDGTTAFPGVNKQRASAFIRLIFTVFFSFFFRFGRTTCVFRILRLDFGLFVEKKILPLGDLGWCWALWQTHLFTAGGVEINRKDKNNLYELRAVGTSTCPTLPPPSCRHDFFPFHEYARSLSLNIHADRAVSQGYYFLV